MVRKRDTESVSVCLCTCVCVKSGPHKALCPFPPYCKSTQPSHFVWLTPTTATKLLITTKYMTTNYSPQTPTSFKDHVTMLGS